MKGVVYQVKGATVDLPTLQQLHFLAPHFLKPQQKSNALLAGAYRSRSQSRGMEFEEVRIYQPGDDVRSIDWRVTARTQTPHTKCFVEEKEKPVLTLVDQRASMFFGSQYCFKSVYACHLSALINWASIERGDRSGGMVMSSDSISYQRPKKTTRSLNQWLQQLCEYNHQLAQQHQQQKLNQKEQPHFLDALKRLKNTIMHSADINIISDFYDLDETCKSLLYDLSKHHNLRFFWLIDPLEKQLPLIHQVTLSNGQDETSVSISTATQKQLSHQFFRKRARLQTLCRELRIDFNEIDITTPLTDIGKDHSSARVDTDG